MRLWHKDLISVLPRKQLVSQWRECCAIIGSIDKKGTPGGPLVNNITRYPLLHFTCYTNLVIEEIQRRGYKISEDAYVRFVNLCNKNIDQFNNDHMHIIIKNSDIYKGWHNNRYLKQCYYNLQEKYDCGILEDWEWDIIEIRGYYNGSKQIQ